MAQGAILGLTRWNFLSVKGVLMCNFDQTGIGFDFKFTGIAVNTPNAVARVGALR